MLRVAAEGAEAPGRINELGFGPLKAVMSLILEIYWCPSTRRPVSRVLRMHGDKSLAVFRP